MRESVSRPGPQCLQSQPHNGQPGSGTPVGHSMEVGTQKVRPVHCRGTREEKVPRAALDRRHPVCLPCPALE